MDNKIGTGLYQTRFAAKPHPVLTLDNLSLDVWLARNLPAKDIENLVPAQSWLTEDHELDLAWRRIRSSEEDMSTIVPLLVCPDDMDFSCSVLVVEQVLSKGRVTWRRFGIDQSHFRDQVGATVRWYDSHCQASFSLSDFIKALDDFQVANVEFEQQMNQTTKRGAVLFRQSYLLEAPANLLEADNQLLLRVESYLSNLPRHLGCLQLHPSLTLEWQGSQTLLLDSATHNCARCEACGQWASNAQFPEPVPEIGLGTVVDKHFLCDECLPEEHPEAF